MATSEKLCLQWNDFKENMSVSFGELRADNDFTDITLACEDGKQIEAHKVVLASSSPFFRELLRRNRNPHPLVYMKGLKSEDLVAMMDFLYKGETNVFQENLDSFLALADELKLKGLNTSGETDRDSHKKMKAHHYEVPLKEENQYEVPPRKDNYMQYRGTNSVHQTEANSSAMDFSNKIVATTTSIENTRVQANATDLDEQIRSMFTTSTVRGERGFIATCNICGIEKAKKDMSRHIEAHHITGVSHTCDICGASSRSKHGLEKHKLRNHNKSQAKLC